MAFENPRFRVMEAPSLQICEYGFVIMMSLELGLKILANGIIFTPNALLKDAAGILDLFIYIVRSRIELMKFNSKLASSLFRFLLYGLCGYQNQFLPAQQRRHLWYFAASAHYAFTI